MNSKKKGNIEFFPHKKKIKYNAKIKFNKNIIKIPTYIIDEIYANKLSIDIYYNHKYMRTYNYDNLNSFIRVMDSKQYNGTFRQEPITYTLAYVEV